jgi:hypothetical protein
MLDFEKTLSVGTNASGQWRGVNAYLPKDQLIICRGAPEIVPAPFVDEFLTNLTALRYCAA